MSLDFQIERGDEPQRTPFTGVHFSHAPIQGGTIHGALRGSSPESSDAHRVHLGGGAPAGVHVYRSGHLAHPAMHSRQHASTVTGDHAVADIDGAQRDLWKTAFQEAFKQSAAAGVDHNTAVSLAQNTAEHALKDAKFTGYEASKHAPGNVILWGDQKVDSV